VWLRHLFVHTGIALIELTVVITWSFDGKPSTVASFVWVVAAALVSFDVGAIIWVGRRPPRGGSAVELADGFRATSLIQLGLATAPALYGIGGVYLFGRTELSWIGAVISVGLLGWVSPTRARLDRVDDQLRLAGMPVSIRPALTES
jgi:hypothetical protein